MNRVNLSLTGLFNRRFVKYNGNAGPIKKAFAGLVDHNNPTVKMMVIGDNYDPEGDSDQDRSHCVEVWKWIGHTALVAISQGWADKLSNRAEGELMNVAREVRRTVTVTDEAFACFVLEYHAGRWAAASRSGQPGRVTGAGVFNNQLQRWAEWQNIIKSRRESEFRPKWLALWADFDGGSGRGRDESWPFVMESLADYGSDKEGGGQT